MTKQITAERARQIAMLNGSTHIEIIEPTENCFKMIKVTTYGDKLMALTAEDELSSFSVIDCKKQLKDWEILAKTETKKIDENFRSKFMDRWEKTGRVELRMYFECSKKINVS